MLFLNSTGGAVSIVQVHCTEDLGVLENCSLSPSPQIDSAKTKVIGCLLSLGTLSEGYLSICFRLLNSIMIRPHQRHCQVCEVSESGQNICTWVVTPSLPTGTESSETFFAWSKETFTFLRVFVDPRKFFSLRKSKELGRGHPFTPHYPSSKVLYH